jgi:hypothetical protein
MIIGFTGTQIGMSKRQLGLFEAFLLNVTEFHHGMCIGADAEAHELVRRFSPLTIIHGHPGLRDVGDRNRSKRANVTVDVLHPEAPFLERNRTIVNLSTILIAAPSTDHEVLRSGTWATIRYAHKLKRNVIRLPR